MKAEIEIDNYLSEDEKKELAQDVFKEMCRNYFRSKDDPEAELLRIAGNSAYIITIDYLNKLYDKNIEEIIKEKMIKILNNDEKISYELFHKSYGYGSNGKGLDLVEKYLSENKELVREKVIEAINNFEYSETVANEICSQVEEVASKFYDAVSRLNDMIIPKSKQQDNERD